MIRSSENMRRFLLLFCLSVSIRAQNQKGDYSIRGTVTNSQTGEPVKSALITLWKVPNPEGTPESFQAAAGKTALAGIGGEFEFTGLSEGQYNLTPQKPGYIIHVVEGNPESSTLIKLTASIAGVQAKLSPLGAIEGKVVDQDSEPIRGVSVSALMINILDGVRYTSAANTVVTNDLGLFRIWNLGNGSV